MITSRHPTLAVDVMGGDFGPHVTIPATLTALKNHADLRIILVGDQFEIETHLHHLPTQSEDRCLVQHAPDTFEKEYGPEDSASSMRMALALVQQKKADACVSAHSSSALIKSACAILKRLPGVAHPALSIITPTLNLHHSIRLLDVGAYCDTQVNDLLQSAVMGFVLSQTIDQISAPRVGLLNISEAPIEGNDLLRQADALLSKKGLALNYVGCIKADSLFKGEVDVVISDGFTGNIALQTIEGGITSMQAYFNQSQGGFSRLASSMIKPFLKQIEKQFNVNYYNGASLVGLEGTIIKSHEKANTEAFYYAIKKAIEEVKNAVPSRITTMIESFK